MHWRSEIKRPTKDVCSWLYVAQTDHPKCGYQEEGLPRKPSAFHEQLREDGEEGGMPFYFVLKEDTQGSGLCLGDSL